MPVRFLLLYPLLKRYIFLSLGMQKSCMEYVYAALVPLCLLAGYVGGLFRTWTVHQRTLALEQHVATLQLAYDDRFKKLSEIVTRQDKSEAAKARWSKKDMQDAALADSLTKKNEVLPFPSHWDPHTFNGA